MPTVKGGQSSSLSMLNGRKQTSVHVQLGISVAKQDTVFTVCLIDLMKWSLRTGSAVLTSKIIVSGGGTYKPVANWVRGRYLCVGLKVVVPLHRCELRQGSAAKFTPASYLATSLSVFRVPGLVSSISLPSELLTHRVFALQHSHCPCCSQPTTYHSRFRPLRTRKPVAGR